MGRYYLSTMRGMLLTINCLDVVKSSVFTFLMIKPQRSIFQSLNIQPGEERVVGLLLGLSSLVSLARIFNTTASSTLFLLKFNASILPYSYISMAVVAPLIGLLNTRFEKRVPFARLHLYNIIAYLLILSALRLAMSLTDAGWPAFIYFIWSEIGWILLNLMLWGLAGRLLTVRQAKRLFGLIAAGGGLATISVGFFIAGIVRGIGVPNLLLLVMIALAGVIGLLVLIGRSYSGQLADTTAEEEDATAPTSAWQTPRKYINMLILMAMVAEASFYFVDIIFYKQVQIQYSSQDKLENYPAAELRKEEGLIKVPESSDVELASFMGKYLAVMNLLVLLSNFFLVAPLIGKLGMRLGLLMMPALTGLVALVFGIGGWMLAPTLFLFRVATFNSMLDWVLRDTVSRSAVLILYQPLPPSARSRTQTQVESIAMPYAQGIAGLALAGLGALGFASLQINWILLALLAGSMFLAFSLGRAYGPVLLEVLSRRVLKLSEQSLALNDPATRALLLRELHSPYPEAVTYALNTLEAMEYPIQDELPALLEHSAPAVRRDTLMRIARLKPPAMIDSVRQALAHEENATVKVAGFHALSALSDEQEAGDLELHLDTKDPTLFIGAMVNLIRKDGKRKDLADRLSAVLVSRNPKERSAGLQIVAELGHGERYASLVSQAIHDEIYDVRRNAIWTAVQLDQADLWDAVFESLNDAHLRATTMGALVSKKEIILPLMHQYLLKPSISHTARVACLRALARLRNPEAIPDLLTHLESKDVEFRHDALLALHRCGYRFDTRNLGRFKKALYMEIADAIQTSSLQTDVEAMDNPMLLHDGLEIAWAHHRERLFLMLRMLYDPSVIQRVRDNVELGSREKRAYALEVLDNVLADEFKPLVFPLLEDIGIARRLDLWNRSFPVLGISNPIKIESILEAPADYSTESRTPWIKSCVIQALVNDSRYKMKIGSLRDENGLVQNTLEWAQAFLSSKKEKKMLSMIERVMILKTVSIFGETPDHLLAEVADLLEEQHLQAGETFISKGDPATCMYIIVNGEVSIHDGDRELNRLGPRDIVGEMAVLDPAPRSASVTTAVPTHLLKLDRPPLFELIADRAEVAQGIIRVLAGRLRNALNPVGR